MRSSRAASCCRSSTSFGAEDSVSEVDDKVRLNCERPEAVLGAVGAVGADVPFWGVCKEDVVDDAPADAVACKVEAPPLAMRPGAASLLRRLLAPLLV